VDFVIRITFGIALPLSLALVAFAPAQEAQRKPADGKKAAKKAIELDEAQETGAVAFAREHHPELAELLSQLKMSNRREYAQAIRELSNASTRLDRIKRQTPDRYDAALDAWKLDSRIKLLAAKSSMAEDPALEVELKDALKQRIELRLRELTAERDRLNARLKNLERQIQTIAANPAAAAEKDLDRIKASIQKDRQRQEQKKQQRAEKKAKKAAKDKARKPAKQAEKPKPAEKDKAKETK
jgi:hypothetical protein